MSSHDVKRLLAELAGTTCRCGEPKRERQTFCQDCYYSLSPATRRKLYAQLGNGYQEAYDEAIDRLTELGILEGES